MNVRSPKHATSGSIDCEYNHPVFGWIPFSASPTDSEALGRSIYFKAIAGDFGPISPLPPPPPPVVPQKVTRAQFILALLQLDLLDDVEAAIAVADRATQINYEERLEFERTHPVTLAMAAAMGKTNQDLDALFVLAATL